MSQTKKYYNWLIKCTKIINENNIKENYIKRRLALAAVLYYLEEKKKRHYKRKSFWVNPLFQIRHKCGFYNAILPTVSQQISTFRNYFRMNAIQLEELLYKVTPLISKETLCRTPISASERLYMTLR